MNPAAFTRLAYQWQGSVGLSSRTGLLVQLFLLLTLVSACGEKEPDPIPLLSVSGKAMGTSWHLTLATDATVDMSVVKAEVDKTLDQINSHMSTYDPRSNLSLFNSEETTDWRAMPEDIINLVDSARRISGDTQGAYDVTLGTVVDLWGFGSQTTTTPDFDSVLNEMNNVGHQLLLVSKDGQQLRKLVPGLKVDLSSIAKGFAVDVVGDALEALGFNRYVFELGGELRTRGQAGNHKPWQIALESPDPKVKARGFHAIAVENAHIATSGDYRNYREVDGRRISHLIDGRSGFPIEHNLASVTVLHGSTAEADAWATAFMVLGTEETLQRADDMSLAVSVTERKGDGFVTTNSKSFEAYLVK